MAVTISLDNQMRYNLGSAHIIIYICVCIFAKCPGDRCSNPG